MPPRLVGGFVLAVLPLVATPGASFLNPKAASIFLTLLPQFVAPQRPLWPQVALLVTAQSLLIAAWLGGWSLVLGRVRKTWRSARWACGLRRLAAVTLVGLGVRTAAG